jgi:predicted DNA-binding protein with PD1-like motif
VGRRLVGRLDRGVEALEALVEVCRERRVRTAEVRARGALESAQVAEFDQQGRVLKAARRFDSPIEVVQLLGHVSERAGRLHVEAHVSLSRERDNGVELLGGRLVAGRVFALEFVIDAFDDLLLRRGLDAKTGLEQWSEAIALEPPGSPDSPHSEERAPAPLPFDAPPPRTTSHSPAPPPAPHAPSWEEVKTASEGAAIDDGLALTEVLVSAGDVIEHPKFGRCEVERVEGDHEFVSARLRNQRLIRLSLDVMTLVPIGKEGARQLFRAVLGR